MSVFTRVYLNVLNRLFYFTDERRPNFYISISCTLNDKNFKQF